jgi:hypothetical protein
MVSQAECDALVALYDATNGPRWFSQSGWSTNSVPCTWYGVTCGANGVIRLSLFSNQLSGSIPASMGDLTDLTHLNLSGNQLSGSIPAAMGKLVHLTDLSLGTNDLTGNITGVMSAIRTNAASNPIKLLMTLRSNGCLTVTDPTLATWLRSRDTLWNNGCP